MVPRVLLALYSAVVEMETAEPVMPIGFVCPVICRRTLAYLFSSLNAANVC